MTSESRYPESIEVSGRRRAVARDEHRMRRKILAVLAAGPMSVPEIAARTGAEPRDVMWWVMGYVRYGQLFPTGERTPDGHGKYGLPVEDD